MNKTNLTRHQSLRQLHLVRQQISTEIKAFRQHQRTMELKVQSLQKETEFISQNLNNELSKQESLKKLLKGLQHKILQRKNQQQNNNQTTNPQSSLNLSKRLHKLQNDIQQLVSKKNEVLAAINEIIEGVDAYRSERVVYSRIYKNLQKELFQRENELMNLILKKMFMEQSSKIPVVQDHSRKTTPVKTESVKETELNQDSVDQTNRKPVQKLKKMDSGIREQLMAIENSALLEFNVRRLMLQLGLQSPEQLINTIQNVQKQNQLNYRRINELSDQIEDLTETNQRLNAQVQVRQNVELGDDRIEVRQQLSATDQSLNKSLNQERKNLKSLMDRLYKVGPLVGLEMKQQQQKNQKNYSQFQQWILQFQRRLYNLFQDCEENNQNRLQRNNLVELLARTQLQKETSKLFSKKQLQEQSKAEIIKTTGGLRKFKKSKR